MNRHLKLLARPTPPIRYPADVALLKTALNNAGYDANDFAIQAAYEDFTEAESAASWLPVTASNAAWWVANKALKYLVDSSASKAG